MLPRASTVNVRESRSYEGYTLIYSLSTGDLEGLKVAHDFTEMDEGEA